LRQIKNFVALTLIAIGTPMLQMGDEVKRPQRGNNNAYCQDNEISWFDWSLADWNAELRRFVKMMIEFRRRRDVVVERAGLAGLTLSSAHVSVMSGARHHFTRFSRTFQRLDQ
jgi:glycogen operon protein